MSRERAYVMPPGDDLFRAFDLMPTVAVWRFVVDGSVRTAAPADAQVDAIFRHACLSDCNDTMARMHGYPDAASLRGRRLVDLMPDVPRNRDYLRRFVTAGYRLSNDALHEALVGHVSNGELVGGTGTRLDSRLLRDLQQASQMKDEFLATLSHELRTPLNAVLGWTRMLRRGTVPPERAGAVLDTIERNAAAHMQLVEELLDLSAMVAGGLRLSVTRVDLRELIGGAVEIVRAAAEAKSIRIRLSIASSVPEIVADPGRIRQMLWNLLANAIKFTPPGGSIDISASRVSGAAEIVVRDTGQGIAADFLPHVFEAFRQADSGATRQVGGLGLGLAIVRHIVEAHGGMAAVHSDGLDLGTTFTIRLPAGRGAAAAADNSDDALDSLRGRRVLAVDDDESTQELVATMLLMYGVSVRTAGRAGQALDILSVWQPDVLLADLAMPGEDGYALVRRVRAMPPPLCSMPAVALTAYTDPQSVQNAFAAGFDAHLGKPLEPHVLADALAKVLRNRR